MRLLSIAALQLDHDVSDPGVSLHDVSDPGVTLHNVSDPGVTLLRFEQRVRALRKTFDDLQLVVAPELHLPAVGGFFDEAAGDPERLAVDVPGPLTERLGELARETRLWLAPGTVYERAGGGGVHNTAIVLSPTGELVARYRKCFPWQPYEESVPGRELVTFDIPNVGRIGLAICHDGAFPEVFRQLAWSGAEVVLQPTLTTTVDRDAEVVLARANAYANQVFVVSVNAASPTALGRSVIVDPEGIVRVEAGSGEELLTDVLDLDAVTRVRTHGAFGLNRLWDELDRVGPSLELPMYGGYRPRERPGD
jgi:formamidase